MLLVPIAAAQDGSSLAAAATSAAGYDGACAGACAAAAADAAASLAGSSPKRIKRSDFPGMDDAAYADMIQGRRKEQAAAREKTRETRDRKGRTYPNRGEQHRKEQEQLSAQRQRYSLQLAVQLGRPFKSAWSDEVPALVMEQIVPANPDAWWLRLQMHGFVAGNMLTSTVETDCLYARARERRHSV
jgi:hypothetical protein